MFDCHNRPIIAVDKIALKKNVIAQPAITFFFCRQYVDFLKDLLLVGIKPSSGRLWLGLLNTPFRLVLR